MSNNSVICDLAYNTQVFEKQLSFAAYMIVTPVYFIVGLLSRVICLAAFYKQYKKEKAFAYQILASLSDMLEVIAVALCMSTRNNLSGFRLPGADWYQKNYFLMWYAAHLASPLEQSFITTSLLISLSMTADRVFALAKPFTYRTINHNRHQSIAAFLSLITGLSTSAFDAFRYQVNKNGDKYVIAVDEAYVATTAAVFFAYFRNIIRIIGNLALVVCSAAMLVCYRAGVNKVGVADANEHRAAKRKSTQKTLLLLTICQSIFTTADITLFNVYYSLVYSDPSFTSCLGKLMAPMDDLTLQVAGVLEFFALVAISKQFRNTILNCLRCKDEKIIVQQGQDTVHRRLSNFATLGEQNAYVQRSGVGQRKLSHEIGINLGQRKISIEMAGANQRRSSNFGLVD